MARRQIAHAMARIKRLPPWERGKKKERKRKRRPHRATSTRKILPYQSRITYRSWRSRILMEYHDTHHKKMSNIARSSKHVGKWYVRFTVCVARYPRYCQVQQPMCRKKFACKVISRQLERKKCESGLWIDVSHGNTATGDAFPPILPEKEK